MLALSLIYIPATTTTTTTTILGCLSKLNLQTFVCLLTLKKELVFNLFFRGMFARCFESDFVYFRRRRRCCCQRFIALLLLLPFDFPSSSPFFFFFFFLSLSSLALAKLILYRRRWNMERAVRVDKPNGAHPRPYPSEAILRPTFARYQHG